MRRHLHLITPGDHFSPLTGSAIPTVVHGLAGATPQYQERPAVLVARGTYGERYGSADVIEYDGAPRGRIDRYLDPVAGRLSLPRPGARRSFAAALADQDEWPDAFLLLHNAPQALALTASRHRAVLYAHNQLLRTYGRREVARALDKARAIVCVSEFLAEDTARHLPSSLHERLVVVHNGVEDQFVATGSRQRTERLHVVFVGRLVRDKGADVLLHAAARLARSDLEVTIVGADGFSTQAAPTEYEKEVARLAATLPHPARMSGFLPRAQVRDVLATADVVVVPSRWEDPCPLAMFEGLGAGAAVVGADIGGIPEVIGGAGVLFPPGDVTELASILEALADDEEYLRQTQEASRQRAAAMSWTHARERLDRVLRRVS